MAGAGILASIAISSCAASWAFSAMVSAAKRPPRPQVVTFETEYRPSHRLSSTFVSGRISVSVNSHHYQGQGLDDWAAGHAAAMTAALAVFPPDYPEDDDDE